MVTSPLQTRQARALPPVPIGRRGPFCSGRGGSEIFPDIQLWLVFTTNDGAYGGGRCIEKREWKGVIRIYRTTPSRPLFHSVFCLSMSVLVRISPYDWRYSAFAVRWFIKLHFRGKSCSSTLFSLLPCMKDPSPMSAEGLFLRHITR
ncbi:hypothetical protein SDC9_85826 [bioreactor metagenome]|uniref:Uncharacterized protein n=1 Tax=bioreactor metagenome TaxID=1076179 RepID=A0A644ZKI6_9ZZZZ